MFYIDSKTFQKLSTQKHARKMYLEAFYLLVLDRIDLLWSMNNFVSFGSKYPKPKYFCKNFL